MPTTLQPCVYLTDIEASLCICSHDIDDKLQSRAHFQRLDRSAKQVWVILQYRDGMKAIVPILETSMRYHRGHVKMVPECELNRNIVNASILNFDSCSPHC